MAKLNQVELETLNTLIKAGMPYQSAIALILGSETTKTQTVSKETVSQPVVAKSNKNNSKSTAKGSKKNSTKGGKPAAKKTEVKVNDYVKVVSTANKLVAIGVVKSIAEGRATMTNGRVYLVANCVAINQKTYGKLSARKAMKKFLENKPEVSSADKFKKAVAFFLKKQGKIDEADFKKALDNAEFRSSLYQQYKEELKPYRADIQKFVEGEASTSEKTQA